MKRLLPTLVCWIAGASAVVAALLAAGPALRLLRGLNPPSILYPFLIGTLTTWTLLFVGGVAVLCRRHWGFVLIYVAAGLNYFAGLSFVPLIGESARSALGSLAAVQGVNLIVVALLVWAQLNIRHSTVGHG
jgi:hypothetical protein